MVIVLRRVTVDCEMQTHQLRAHTWPLDILWLRRRSVCMRAEVGAPRVAMVVVVACAGWGGRMDENSEGQFQFAMGE